MTVQRALLFMFMVMIPFTDVSRVYLGGVSAVEVLLVILGSLLIMRMVHGTALIITPGALLALGISLLAVLAYLWAAATQGPAIPIQTTFWVEYGLIYMMVLQYTKDADLRDAAVLGLLAGAALAGGVVLVHWMLGPQETLFHRWGPEWAVGETRATFRVYGSFNNPLNLAGYFAVVAGASAYVLSSSRSRPVLVAATLYFALSGAVLVATGSKIVLFVLVVFGVLLVRRPIAVPALAVAALAMWVSGYADTLINRLADNPLESGSVTERIYLLTSFSRMIIDQPVLGFGAETFKESYYYTYRNPAASLNPRMFTSENMFLEVAVQMGLLGALLLLTLIVRSMWLGFAPSAPVSLRNCAIRIVPAVSFAVLGFAVVGMIQSMASPSLNYLLFTVLALQEVASGSAVARIHVAEAPRHKLMPSKQG